MSQLFSNIISNALKFTKPDIIPHISITSNCVPASEAAQYLVVNMDTDYCIIECEDNGIGFKQEHASQIFNIFQRLHGKGDFAGTGIGLAMCKKIALNHRGDIFAVSKISNGAIFRIVLPLKQINPS